MEKVKVKKEELLLLLEKNRSDHKSVFEETFANYRKEVIRLLKEAVVKTESGKEIVTYLAVDEPTNHTKDYDIAIGMLKMCVDKEIEITYQEYRNYVLNDWHWTKDFVRSNSPYSSSSSSSSILSSLRSTCDLKD